MSLKNFPEVNASLTPETPCRILLGRRLRLLRSPVDWRVDPLPPTFSSPESEDGVPGGLEGGLTGGLSTLVDIPAARARLI